MGASFYAAMRGDQGKRGVGLFIPAWHQTRDECDLLVLGLVPQTRLEVWTSARWLSPHDPAFQEILGSEDLDMAVFDRHEWDEEKKQLRLARHSSRRKHHHGHGHARSQSADATTPSIVVTEHGDRDLNSHPSNDSLASGGSARRSVPSRQPSVRFVRSLRKTRSHRDLRKEASLRTVD